MPLPVSLFLFSNSSPFSMLPMFQMSTLFRCSYSLLNSLPYSTVSSTQLTQPFHARISRIVSSQPVFKSYCGTKPSSFWMRLPLTAISSVYLSMIAPVIGVFKPMAWLPFSIIPINVRVGPTGNDNRGGLRPRAEQMDSIISFKGWNPPSVTLNTRPAPTPTGLVWGQDEKQPVQPHGQHPYHKPASVDWDHFRQG